MKILLIDDDDFLREMYVKKLEVSGFDVTATDGSVSTLSLLSEGATFDLALLDMIMPGTTGIELLQIINERFPDSIKKVVFLTNQGQRGDIIEARDAGAVGFIIKANTIPSEVVDEVKKILEQDD